MTTNVPSITFTATGPQAPTAAAILTGVQEDFNAAFGGNLNPALNTPQGQLASSEAAIIADSNAQQLALFNNVDPAYAYGRWQDAIGRIYFLTRITAQPTVVQCTCTGLSGVAIPVGALAADTAGNLYTCTTAGTIGSGGTVSLPFANQVTGAIPCPANTLTTISQAIPGWDSITNPSQGVLGNAVESRSAFEARREASVAINAVSTVSAIQGAVLAVPGVLDAYVIDNPSGGSVTNGDYTLAPHSIYVAAYGGNELAVATAIWSKKPPGCSYNGNTTVTVYDSNSGYEAPYPSYSVSYEIPTALPIYFAVTMVNSAAVPSNGAALVQAAIISAFAGGDGGPRARIGATIFALRFYSPIVALGSWAQVVSIQIGTTSSPALNELTVGIDYIPTIVSADIAVTFM